MSTHNPSWQSGDKALCIRTSLWRDCNGELASDNSPIKGETYLVNGVLVKSASQSWLYLSGFAGWWDAKEFVKSNPINELRSAIESSANKA